MDMMPGFESLRMIHVRLVVYWVYLVPVCAIVRNLFMCTKLCIEFTPLPVCVVVSILVSMVFGVQLY